MIMKSMDKNYECSIEYEWSKWRGEIPSIKFKQEWEVRIIPPFAGAIVRFVVDGVSVYLDCYDILGCFGEPYWEIYPYEGDTYRCKMNNVDELLEAIQHSIDNKESIDN